MRSVSISDPASTRDARLLWTDILRKPLPAPVQSFNSTALWKNATTATSGSSSVRVLACTRKSEKSAKRHLLRFHDPVEYSDIYSANKRSGEPQASADRSLRFPSAARFADLIESQKGNRNDLY